MNDFLRVKTVNKDDQETKVHLVLRVWLDLPVHLVKLVSVDLKVFQVNPDHLVFLDVLETKDHKEILDCKVHPDLLECLYYKIVLLK